MENVPAYVSAVFILTTFAALAILLQAAKAADLQTRAGRLLIFVLPLWIALQTVLGVGGFYQRTDSFPPRIFLYGVLPPVILSLVYLVFFRPSFIDRLPLRLLTLVHVVRIPVEIVLYWLAAAGAVPTIMTFAGWNFDIASGILAAVVFVVAFRKGSADKRLLIAFNVIGLLLLINIVTIAVLSLPTPVQQLAFDQPNRAVLAFPYNFLPSIVVPIVLFAHLAALYKSLRAARVEG